MIISKSPRILEVDAPIEKINSMIDTLKLELKKEEPDHIEVKVLLINIKSIASKFELRQLLGIQLYQQAMAI